MARHASSESGHYLLALDAGTGSVRAVIFDLHGHQIAVGQAEWTHREVPGVPGSMEFDLEKNAELVYQCIRAALTSAALSPAVIVALAACSMREGIVLYDASGEPIWACANVDARAVEEVRALKALHQQGFEQHRSDPHRSEQYNFEQQMYRDSGQTLALGALPRLLWLARHRPELYQRAATLTMISDWVAHLLCGELAVDPSNAGTTGLLDLKTRHWRPEWLHSAGLRSDMLPAVKETGSLLGKVTWHAAQACGLLAGTPVVVGGGDVQLGCVGLGVVRAAQTAVLGGTFWQQVVNLSATDTDPQMNVRINPHVIPGMVQAECISFFTGMTLRWFRDAFCGEEKRQAAQQGGDAWSLLEAMSGQVPPGAHGVMPIFSDVMRFKNWYHAAPSFINLSLDPEKCNKATLFRALQENAAVVCACNLRQVADFSGVKAPYLVFAGGGAKGRLWSQILADVTGLPVRVPVVKEATALGCAIAAGVGAGVMPSLAITGEQLVAWEREHQPVMENHEIYQTVIEKWQAIYPQQRSLVDQHLTTSLWKAPGL